MRGVLEPNQGNWGCSARGGCDGARLGVERRCRANRLWVEVTGGWVAVLRRRRLVVGILTVE